MSGRVRARRAVAGLGAAALLLAAVLGSGSAAESIAARSHPHSAADSVFRAAEADWDRGDYVLALEGFLRVLDSPAAERLLEPVALITGELYHTLEVAGDGRAVRFSPDGRRITYETGSGADRRTRIVESGPPFETVAELPGHGVVFAPPASGLDVVAYLTIAEDEALAAARAELADLGAAGADRQTRLDAQARLRWTEAERTAVTIRDLAGEREARLTPEDRIPLEFAFSPDGATLYVVSMRTADPTATELLSLPALFEPVAGAGAVRGRVSGGRGFAADLLVTPDGRILIYTLSGRSPLPDGPGVPAVPAPELGHQVVIEDMVDRERLAFPGAAPTLSADGSTLAFYSVDGDDNLIITAALDGDREPVIAHRTADPLGPPVLSPSGEQVAFYQRPGVSWHLYRVARDGTGLSQVGEDVQHELFPRFLAEDLLLGVMGEFRHRRSQLYDLRTDERVRLFHNNTVRTIAPQYEWEPSPDGGMILVAAERDGDTVSPEVGVYLVDLERRVTASELRARIERQLEAERELRERAAAMFEPIAEQVRAAAARVSAERLYEYQEALYGFGSKHITMPGNRPAGEYVHETLASFGYEPEYQWLPPLEAVPASSPSATSASLRFEPTPEIRTANVVAVLPGTERPDLIYVLSSHYDSVRESPGADDNSSGTAVLLETARVLAETPLPATVVFAALTGEESGLLGALEFVRLARERGDRIVGVLNNDMLGWTRDHRLDNTVRYTSPEIRDIQHGAAILFSDLVTYDARYVRGTDAAVFWEAYGDVTGGIGSYPVLSNPNYHQPTDRLETINQELVTESARATIAAMMLLASPTVR